MRLRAIIYRTINPDTNELRKIPLSKILNDMKFRHLFICANYILQYSPQTIVRYVHAEDYYSDVVRAYQKKSFDSFKKYYRSLDVLLLDDVQFLNGKNRTQEELFFVFNTLIESHKQIVISCDTYPKRYFRP